MFHHLMYSANKLYAPEPPLANRVRVPHVFPPPLTETDVGTAFTVISTEEYTVQNHPEAVAHLDAPLLNRVV